MADKLMDRPLPSLAQWLGDGAEWAARHFPGRPVQQISSGHTLVHVGKARAGRLLDGRTHDAMPATHREKETV